MPSELTLAFGYRMPMSDFDQGALPSPNRAMTIANEGSPARLREPPEF
jgi:hypothetical protein